MLTTSHIKIFMCPNVSRRRGLRYVRASIIGFSCITVILYVHPAASEDAARTAALPLLRSRSQQLRQRLAFYASAEAIPFAASHDGHPGGKS